eukprot:TRINITY_DN110723_c0_g1_i1.p1 TRINITY_DN110723_c0_g1~~TRINITY_DN110723_c0_g1_i1.p1  ORF type:complete len:283 (+),score=62.55 TRINITY_DN110723_c0_g1_i1:30-878(+)
MLPRKAARKTAAEVTLFANIGCPYAERAMFALNLRPKSVRKETVPTTNQFGLLDKLGVARGDTFGLFQGKSLEELHSFKEWYKNTINASGEVPAMRLETGEVVRESEILAEYLDAVSESEGDRKLIPVDALAASKVRLAMKMFNAVPACIVTLLKNQDPSKDAELAGRLTDTLGKFVAVLEDESDFCIGQVCTLADVHAVAFLHRFSVVLKHYRGFDMLREHPRLGRVLGAVMAMPEYQSLMQEYGVTDAKFIEAYELYANDGIWSQDGTKLAGRGQSQLGK